MSFAFRLDVGEVRELAARLEDTAGRVVFEGRAVTITYANAIAEEARRLAPVDTGYLRSSITSTPGGEAAALGIAMSDVHVDAPYAGFVEFGTVHMAPQPYLRPAVERYRGPYRDAMQEVAASVLGKTRAGRMSAPRRFSRTSAVRNARFDND